MNVDKTICNEQDCVKIMSLNICMENFTIGEDKKKSQTLNPVDSLHR